MSQISKYKLNEKVYSKIFSLFPQFLARMTIRGYQNDFVDSFFTRTEKIVIAKRIAIAFMLTKGYKYEQIVNKIKVSHGTVAKIADSLKAHNEVITRELENIAKDDAFVSFLSSVGYQVSKALPPKGRSWKSWRSNLEKENRATEQPF